MTEPMSTRTTVDTYSGKSFRWNAVDSWSPPEGGEVGLNVPARYTNSTATALHPTRVVMVLLQELNPGVDIQAALLGYYTEGSKS